MTIFDKKWLNWNNIHCKLYLLKGWKHFLIFFSGATFELPCNCKLLIIKSYLLSKRLNNNFICLLLNVFRFFFFKLKQKFFRISDYIYTCFFCKIQIIATYIIVFSRWKTRLKFFGWFIDGILKNFFKFFMLLIPK